MVTATAQPRRAARPAATNENRPAPNHQATDSRKPDSRKPDPREGAGEPQDGPTGNGSAPCLLLLAALAAAALLTAVAMLSLARLVVRASVATRLGAFALLVGVAATLSRAGIAGCGLGIGVFALLLGPRRVVTGTARTIVGASVAVIGLLPSMPVGSTARPGWAVLALVLGAAVAGAPPLPRRWVGAAGTGLAVVAVGSPIKALVCTGGIQKVTVAITPVNKPFVAGTAFGQADVFDCNFFTCSSATDQRSVKLAVKKKK